MLTPELLARLTAAGLPIRQHQAYPSVCWFAGERGEAGPFATAEDALVAGVLWLKQRCDEYCADRVNDEEIRQLRQEPPDEAPEPFRELLG